MQTAVGGKVKNTAKNLSSLRLSAFNQTETLRSKSSGKNLTKDEETQGRIYGGREVEQGRYPYLAAHI